MNAPERGGQHEAQAVTRLDGLRMSADQRDPVARAPALAVCIALLLAGGAAGAGAMYLTQPWSSPGPQAGAPAAHATPAGPGQAMPQAAAPGARPGAGLVINGFLVARRTATVSSQVSGRLETVLVQQGMRVSKGQPVALLDTRDVNVQFALAQSQVRTAQARIAEFEVEIMRAHKDTERAKLLGASGMLNAAAVDDAALKHQALVRQMQTAKETVRSQQIGLQLAGIARDNATIRAPLAGVVVATSAQPGEIVSPLSAVGSGTRSGICTIADLDSLEVQLEVPERLLHKVRLGQAVTVAMDALPGVILKGEVVLIASSAHRGAGSVPIHVAVDLKNRNLLPDMTATVTWDSK